MSQESFDLLRHHWNYDEHAPLEVKQKQIQVRDGIELLDISYTSPVGDRAASVGPNGGIVAACLIVPPGRGPFPAVIYGHWCMPGSDKKNRTEFLDEALVLAHSGVISLLPNHVSVHPGFVEDTAALKEQQIAVNAYQRLDAKKLAALEDPNVEIVDRFGELHLPSGRSADQQLGRCFRIVSTNSPPDALASSVIASRRTGEHAREQLRLNLLTCDHENCRETIEAFCFWLLM